MLDSYFAGYKIKFSNLLTIHDMEIKFVLLLHKEKKCVSWDSTFWEPLVQCTRTDVALACLRPVCLASSPAVLLLVCHLPSTLKVLHSWISSIIFVLCYVCLLLCTVTALCVTRTWAILLAHDVRGSRPQKEEPVSWCRGDRGPRHLRRGPLWCLGCCCQACAWGKVYRFCLFSAFNVLLVLVTVLTVGVFQLRSDEIRVLFESLNEPFDFVHLTNDFY